MVKILPRGGHLRLVVLTAGVLASAGLSVLFTIMSGALVGAVPEAVGQGLASEPGRHLVRMVALAAALFTLNQTIGPFVDLLVSELGRRINNQLRLRVMKASLAPVGIGHLEDPDLQNKLDNARRLGPTGVDPRHAVEGLVGILTTRLTGTMYFLLVARQMPLLAVVLAGMWLVLYRFLRRDFLETIQLLVGGTERLRRSHYFRWLALGHDAAKEVRLFGIADWVRAAFKDSWLNLMKSVWQERRRGKRRVATAAVAIGVAYGVSLWLVAREGIAGSMSIGEIMVVTSAIFGLSNLGSPNNNDYQVEYGGAVIPKVEELEQAVSKVASVDLTGQDPAGLPREEIRFSAITFRYPGRDEPVFDNLDLTVETGRSLAIVGENGAGKTTLVKLLARMHDPQSGEMTVDGQRIDEYNARMWQRRIGAIFQDFTRYPLPVRENVGFGASDHMDNPEDLTRAADLAGASAIIERLPRKWDTILDRRYTDGADLSGGEWQRIALARALFAINAGAGVLVLDEPTANLDARAEAEIYDRFLDMTRGRTAIVISHRFSTVRRADRIVVLAEGRVTEDGTHDELVSRGGRYADMFAMQASRFASGGSDDA